MEFDLQWLLIGLPIAFGLSSARRVRVRAIRRWRHQLGTIAKMPKAQPRPNAARTMKTIGARHS